MILKTEILSLRILSLRIDRTLMTTPMGLASSCVLLARLRLSLSEKGEVLLRGVGTLRYSLILSESSACQVPICAVAA